MFKKGAWVEEMTAPTTNLKILLDLYEERISRLEEQVRALQEVTSTQAMAINRATHDEKQKTLMEKLFG